jgi:uncharacterized membrane protein YdjX (TVP38/TMEM64 family)
VSTEAALLKRFAPLALVGAGLAAAVLLGWTDYLSLEQLRERREELVAWVDTHPVLSVAAFMGLYCLVVAFSIPGALILTLSGGFLFGTWVGTVATVLGATAGAVVIFLAARSAFRDVLRRRAGSAVARFEQGVREHAFSYVLTLRLLPIFPFWLVNIGLALVGMPLRTFALATLLGVIPGTFVYSALGAGLGTVFDRDEEPNLSLIFEPEILLPLVALALLSLAPVVVRRFRRPG